MLSAWHMQLQVLQAQQCLDAAYISSFGMASIAYAVAKQCTTRVMQQCGNCQLESPADRLPVPRSKQGADMGSTVYP
jgi:hypothetical protein